MYLVKERPIREEGGELREENYTKKKGSIVT